MTDNEYATIIYCAMFRLEEADEDMCVQGVLDGIKSLDEKKQQILEHYYRHGMTYAQVGEHLGISRTWVGQVITKSMLILKHPTRSRKMCWSEIRKHQEEMKRIIHTQTILPQEEKKPDDVNGKTSICVLGLSTKTFNCLYRTGRYYVESVLEMDSHDLIRIRNFGDASRIEVITKMREHGYSEWANKMQAVLS